LSKILVKEGQRVQKGQIIGVQGSTGRSTGAHLHYEVRLNDRPLNPAKFLKAGEYVSKE
jgi:murein DD-endopeptidase MepM/ murein hydrolase activator NlpD